MVHKIYRVRQYYVNLIKMEFEKLFLRKDYLEKQKDLFLLMNVRI